MAVAIDSSVLVRYFTKDDAKLFDRAAKILAASAPSSILLDRLIIAELGYVLRSVYGLKKDQLMTVYKSLLNSDLFTIPERELTESTVDLFGKEKPLSFEDCWLLSLKQAKKVNNVLTFDGGLQKRLSTAL